MRDELVVVSHLRWTWVWQRPQHLVSRLARRRRTWFVEEPVVAAVDAPRLCVRREDPVTRVWLEVPGEGGHADFTDPAAEGYAAMVGDLLGHRDGRCLWLYTPLARPFAEAVPHGLLVYDVMDDLAAFSGASPALRHAQRRVLEDAHLVFTGGRSLYEGVRDRAGARAHLFPSGVDPEHYERARSHRLPGGRPVAGYVGVIDERIDLELVRGLAERLPGWEIRMVGPVAKIDPDSLPQAPNLVYPGMQPYARLPEVMGGFDVALMPFAINAATRSISPTKTLEYLAAGLPVVSTRVPDVVADYPGVVHLADDAAGFAGACREVHGHCRDTRDARVEPLLDRQRWDTIAARMDGLMRRAHAAAARVAPTGLEVAS